MDKSKHDKDRLIVSANGQAAISRPASPSYVSNPSLAFYYAEQHTIPVTRSWRYKVVMRRWVRMDLLQSPQNGPLLARID